MRIRIIVLVGLIAAVSVGGCGAEDVVTTAPDCTDVCDRYEECFDDDFDVVGCTADCADASIDDEDFQDRLDDCEACIDQTCGAPVFTCTAVCEGIVP